MPWKAVVSVRKHDEYICFTWLLYSSPSNHNFLRNQAHHTIRWSSAGIEYSCVLQHFHCKQLQVALIDSNSALRPRAAEAHATHWQQAVLFCRRATSSLRPRLLGQPSEWNGDRGLCFSCFGQQWRHVAASVCRAVLFADEHIGLKFWEFLLRSARFMVDPLAAPWLRACRWYVYQWVGSNGGMLTTEGKPNYSGKNLHHCYFVNLTDQTKRSENGREWQQNLSRT